MFRRNQIITAVEIATSKTSVLIGDADDEGNLTVVNHGEVPSSEGVVKGDIIDMEIAAATLAEAIEKAESGDSVIDRHHLFIAISGAHINSQQGIGSLIISDDDRKVKATHISEVMKNAQNIPMNSHDRIVLNSFDKYYLLDGDTNRRVSNPIDQIAHKLDAYVHIVCGDRNRIENFKSLLYEISDDTDPVPVFSGIASVYGVLKPVETENGVLMIDMGAGITEFVLVHQSGIHLSGVIPVGCEHLANDLSLGLELNISICRKILTDQSYIQCREEGQSFLEIAGTLRNGVRKIPVNSIEKIIQLRLRELFELIHNEVSSHHLLSRISTGVVLTGGGALIPQSQQLLRSVFDTPVRIGVPEDVSGAVTELNSPRYSTVWGLLRCGHILLSGESSINDKRPSISGFINSLDKYSSNFLKKISTLKDSIKF